MEASQHDLKQRVEAFNTRNSASSPLSLSDFKGLTPISSDSSSAVFAGSLSHNGHELKYAIKMPNANASEAEAKESKEHKNTDLERVIRAASKSGAVANHDNIVYFFGSVPANVSPSETSAAATNATDAKTRSTSAALVFELCDGDLGALLRARAKANRPFDDDELLMIASDLLCALTDIHKSGHVHLDVTLSNALYCTREGKTRLKLADFALAKQCGHGRVLVFDDVSASYEGVAKLLAETGKSRHLGLSIINNHVRERQHLLSTAPEARSSTETALVVVEPGDAQLLDAWLVVLCLRLLVLWLSFFG